MQQPPQMTSPAERRRTKVCLATYAESYLPVPPMFNEGVSLAREGFEVEALGITSSHVPATPEAHTPGFYTRRFRVHTRSLFHVAFGRVVRGRGFPVLRYLLSYLEFVTKTIIYAWRSRADIYEAHDLPALLPLVVTAKLRGKPVAYHAHELWSETSAEDRFAGVWRLLDRALVPRCDLVVTPEENRSRILKEEFGAKHEPLTVRNCPPYQVPFQSDRLHDELRRRGMAFSTIVLYQGLIDSRRCIEEIAKATRHFDDGILLVIIGPGFGKWANPVSTLAGYDRVVVLPPVAYEDLLSYTASAHIGMLLYRNDCRNNYYCAPNKVFEYTMMGVPVIAPDYPGIKRFVEGEGVGICVDPENPTEIAAAVNRMARDPAARARMRAAGLSATRERYNWEEEFRPLLRRFRLLLEHQAPTTP